MHRPAMAAAQPVQRGRGGLLPLHDARLHLLQRQALVASMGQVQGNHALSALLTATDRRPLPAAGPALRQIQRDASGAPPSMLADAMVRGIHNETQLTDLLFYARHPERNRRPIEPQSEAPLVQEWLTIRADEVRPALQSSGQVRNVLPPGGQATLHQAVAGGERNEVRLTDQLFFARHPERNGRSIDPQGEAALAQEWVMLRDTQVRPALAAAPAATPAAVPPAERPSPSEARVTPEPAPAPASEPAAPPAVDATHSDRLRQLEEMVVALRQMQQEAEMTQAGSAGDGKLWRALSDTGALRHYREAGLNRVQAMAGMLMAARQLLRSLTVGDVGGDPGALARIQGHYHRELNALTPYFTQMANQNWLYDPNMSAWERTCSLTSLAMTLQAMGLQPKDFIGDVRQLTEVAQRFEARFASFGELATLRMPDFLQLVLIFVKYGQATGATIEQRVAQARYLAASVISTTLDIFVQVAGQFGVERTYTGFIRSTGQLKNDAGGGAVASGQYQQEVLRQLTPWLDQGGQVVVNLPGHYVRLEAVEANGLVIDDPAYAGKNFKVGWEQANQEGYFRSYQVFMKR